MNASQAFGQLGPAGIVAAQVRVGGHQSALATCEPSEVHDGAKPPSTRSQNHYMGLVPFAVIVVLAVRNAGRDLLRSPSPDTWMWAAVVAVMLIENATESFILRFFYNWVIVMAAALRTPEGTKPGQLASSRIGIVAQASRLWGGVHQPQQTRPAIVITGDGIQPRTKVKSDTSTDEPPRVLRRLDKFGLGGRPPSCGLKKRSVARPDAVGSGECLARGSHRHIARVLRPGRNLSGWRGFCDSRWPLTWGFVSPDIVAAGICRGDI